MPTTSTAVGATTAAYIYTVFISIDAISYTWYIITEVRQAN